VQMRLGSLSILIVFICVSTAFGQRDAPVWESFLPQISVYHDASDRPQAVKVEFLFKKEGGPHEHTEHQAYVLVYLQKDEAQILKLAADPQLRNKKNEKTKRFLDVLVEKKLVVPLQSQVAKIIEVSMSRSAAGQVSPKRAGDDDDDIESVFPFKFTFANNTLFQSVQKLGNFDPKSVDVVGDYTWYKDKFKLMVFVPVNDSAQADKVSAELRKMYDFAGLMDFESSVLYFRPLPYEFMFKSYKDDPLMMIYIN
jgi:hypothetical protein